MEGLSSAELTLSILNGLLALVAFFGTIVGKNLTEAIRELKQTDKELSDKFELYARRDDLTEIKHQLAGIFNRLDDIKDRISDKVSREECAMHRMESRNGK